mgnify:CR=1 FL=1
MSARPLMVFMLSVLVTGCHTWRPVQPSALAQIIPETKPSQDRVTVHGRDTETILHAPVWVRDSLQGEATHSGDFGSTRTMSSIPLQDLMTSEVRQLSTRKTAAFTGAMLGAVIGGIVGYTGYTPDERTCSPGGTSPLFGRYGSSCSGGHDATVHAAETIVGVGIGALGGALGGWIVGVIIER